MSEITFDAQPGRGGLAHVGVSPVLLLAVVPAQPRERADARGQFVFPVQAKAVFEALLASVNYMVRPRRVSTILSNRAGLFTASA
jgi:hypothetical protein